MFLSEFLLLGFKALGAIKRLSFEGCVSVYCLALYLPALFLWTLRSCATSHPPYQILSPFAGVFSEAVPP